ncbi:MAG: DUF3783 domain-containing protein [Fusobacteriota bacterium]
MAFKEIKKDAKKRPEGNNCVMVYGYDDNQIDILENKVRAVGIDDLYNIKTENTHNTLTEIANGKLDKKDNLEDLPEKAVVFNAVSDSELNDFITLYEDNILGKTLFAVVTENSKSWSFSKLINELIREREEIESLA